MSEHNVTDPSINRSEHSEEGGVNAKRVYLYGWDYGAGLPRRLAAIESANDPGVYGLLVLNYDGSEISGGGTSTPPAVDNLLMETGDGLLLETGDLILTE